MRQGRWYPTGVRLADRRILIVSGQTGRTAALGTGIERGRRDNPVTVEVGDSDEMINTGTV
jgi:hypothetical protein